LDIKAFSNIELGQGMDCMQLIWAVIKEQNNADFVYNT
jgi:hypothetical protein